MVTTMDFLEALSALRKLKVETGSLACTGCGMEHSCSIHGCAIIRNAVEYMEVALERYDHWSLLLDEYELRLQRCDGAGVDPVEHSKICKERDELCAAYEAAKQALKVLNDRLVQQDAELQKVIAELHEVKSDRDALAGIVAKAVTACEVCVHEHQGLPCGDLAEPLSCEGCVLDKGICCACENGSRFAFKGCDANG